MDNARSSASIRIRLSTLLLAVFAASAPAREDVVILVNKTMPASVKLGERYAKARDIAKKLVCEVDCSQNETMAREEYDKAIRDPLLRFLQNESVLAKVRYIAICHGIPLKIKGAKRIVRTPDGSERERGNSHGAVDSELAMLFWKAHSLEGTVRNPYYGQDAPIGPMFRPGLLLVTRLDGPNPEVAGALIDRSLEGERVGIHGRGYFDLRGIDKGGYAMGDRWIGKAAEVCAAKGFPCEVDREGALFSESFPMSDTAFYFGWYAQRVVGPFKRAGFRVRPGAVTYHLVSNSAHSIRKNSWVTTFVKEGAAATMGAVYEPYLSGTINCGLFLDRFLKGYTFAESCYMATEYLSWQMTFIGDPLYAPFREELVKAQQKALKKADKDTQRLAAIQEILRACNKETRGRKEKKEEAEREPSQAVLELAREKLPLFNNTRHLEPLFQAFLTGKALAEAVVLSKEIDAAAQEESHRGALWYALARIHAARGDSGEVLKTLDPLISQLPKHGLVEAATLMAIKTARNKGETDRLPGYWMRLKELGKTPYWQANATSELWLAGEVEKHGGRVLLASPAKVAIKLDGIGDEEVWKKAEVSSGFQIEKKRKLQPVEKEMGTSVKALFDEKNVYLLFDCRHAKMESVKLDPTTPRGQIWTKESLELFVCPARDYSRYVQLMTNPLGVKFISPFGHKMKRDKWQVSAKRDAKGWTAEVAIPFVSLGVKPPASGDAWGVNFCRNAKPGPGSSTWSPITGSWHKPTHFGYLLFGERKKK